MRSTLCALVISVTGAAFLPTATATGPDLQPGLEALRAGRFEEAERRFSRLSREVPEAPEGPFFQAFEMWWKLLDRYHERPGLRLLMEGRLDEAARRATVLAGSGAGPQHERGLIFLGVARLLDAQSKAARGAHMSASGSARQGHRALTEALRLNPHASDALFGMGAYNYFADNLPAIVKGIRFLLLIPGGDRERGIAQLEEAAASSRLFGTEALMLLAFIHAGPNEDNHARALEYIGQARAREPDSPLIALVHADLLFDVGRLRESEELSTRVAQALRGQRGYMEDLRRYAGFRAATCTLRRHDPLGALALVEDALASSPPETAGERKRWLALLLASARESGDTGRAAAWIDRLSMPAGEADAWRHRVHDVRADPVARDRAEALHLVAQGRTREGLSRLETLQTSHPLDPRLRYDLGRIFQQERRFDQARPHLLAVARQGPAELAGWAWIRLGWEEEQEGRREESLERYARAAAMKKFSFQPAAHLRMSRAGEGPPEG